MSGESKLDLKQVGGGKPLSKNRNCEQDLVAHKFRYLIDKFL